MFFGLSTIVEIIRAYQPYHVRKLLLLIYNSRNYQSLLAIKSHDASKYIYNSRNYQSLLALHEALAVLLTSTIVEIIRAYQPTFYERISIQVSTIVEIIRAYQPHDEDGEDVSYLQQQKLLELTSLNQSPSILLLDLQQQKLLELTSHLSSTEKHYKSTIVEIIRAYQPYSLRLAQYPISTIVEIIRAYQPWRRMKTSMLIYNSRNYQSLLAVQNILVMETDLQQQKLLELTSQI